MRALDLTAHGAVKIGRLADTGMDRIHPSYLAVSSNRT